MAQKLIEVPGGRIAVELHPPTASVNGAPHLVVQHRNRNRNRHRNRAGGPAVGRFGGRSMSSGTPAAPPVLISGGGPAGLSLAIELGLRGVPCTVVEPRREVTTLRPRAKTLNTRTLEHLRRWGLADRLRERAPLPTAWSQDVAFCTSFLGAEITRFTGVLGLGDDGVSPELGQQMPQYVLEAFLREVVDELPTCTVMLGSRVTGLEQTASAVTVDVSDADGGTTRLESAYVVGADGSRSVVREAIGARYEGSQGLRPNTGVVFRSEALRDLQPHAPAVQTWLLNDQTPGMMGPIDRKGTWWLIAFGVDGTSPDLDPQRLIDGALGRRVPSEVISVDPWTARMELVDRACEGRVFLIGDAAHLNPPFGGHGLNTGIGDAVDLGWKLAATLDGWAGPGLLASYEAERRPLHRRVIDEAALNMATLAPELFSADLDDPGPVGEEARVRAAQRIEETKRAEYFSRDLVLGHRIATSPILPSAPGADSGPVSTDGPDDGGIDKVGPGRRLPHRWVSPGVSTLDLVSGGTGPGHVVLASTSSSAAGAELVSAAGRAGVPLACELVDEAVMDAMGARLVLVRPDQIVSWSGERTPADADALISHVAGRSVAATPPTT